MREWMDVAVLTKTRNLKGGLVVQGATGLPFLLSEGDEVAFVPPQTDLPRRACVQWVRKIDELSAEVGFESVDADTARGLVGCHCLIRRDELDVTAFEEEPALWNGWSVVDAKAGFVGRVADVIDNPGQMLLEVERCTESDTTGQGRVLVPVVDEIVLDVDLEACKVQVDLPNGLLDL